MFSRIRMKNVARSTNSRCREQDKRHGVLAFRGQFIKIYLWMPAKGSAPKSNVSVSARIIIAATSFIDAERCVIVRFAPCNLLHFFFFFHFFLIRSFRSPCTSTHRSCTSIKHDCTDSFDDDEAKVDWKIEMTDQVTIIELFGQALLTYEIK